MNSLQQDLEALRASKPLLLEALHEETGRAEWLQRLNPAAADVLSRLADASDEELEAWTEQVAAEDSELADLIHEFLSMLPEAPGWLEAASVFRFADRVTEVKFSAHLSFEIEDPRPIIRLIFLAGEEADRLALTSDQDLEDTLHIGQSVCGAIAETLRLAQEHGIPLRSDHFGESFGDLLDELEETVRALRHSYNQSRKPSEA